MSITYRITFGYGFRMSMKSSDEVPEDELNEIFGETEKGEQGVLPIFDYIDFDDQDNLHDVAEHLRFCYDGLKDFEYFGEFNESTDEYDFVVFLKDHYFDNSVGGGAYELHYGVNVISPPKSINDWTDERKFEMEDLFRWFDFHSVEPEVVSLVTVG